MPPARGATKEFTFYWIYSVISIHAPREGGDAAGRSYIPHQAISIHAPREGGDAGPVLVLCVQRNFNPRPPRGGRPQGRYARQHL